MICSLLCCMHVLIMHSEWVGWRRLHSNLTPPPPPRAAAVLWATSSAVVALEEVEVATQDTPLLE